MSKTRLCLVLLSLILTASAVAQEFQVQDTTGTTEAKIPELGWRRAVLGRLVPAGSVLTSWRDSSLTVARGDLSFELKGLTHLRIVSASADRVELSLTAGTLSVASPGSILIEVPIRDASIRSDGPLRISVTTTLVAIAEGAAAVTLAGGRTVEVAGPAVVDLTPLGHGPLFEQPLF